MKALIALPILAALLLASATTVLASHGATTLAASIPPHGSIWIGSGLDHFSATIPPHGSIWFGEGLNMLTQPITHGQIPATADILRAPYFDGTGLVAMADVLRGVYEYEAPVAQISLADIVRSPYHESGIGLTLFAEHATR